MNDKKIQIDPKTVERFIRWGLLFFMWTVAYLILLLNVYLLMDDPSDLAKAHLYLGSFYFNGVGTALYFVIKPCHKKP